MDHDLFPTINRYRIIYKYVYRVSEMWMSNCVGIAREIHETQGQIFEITIFWTFLDIYSNLSEMSNDFSLWFFVYYCFTLLLEFTFGTPCTPDMPCWTNKSVTNGNSLCLTIILTNSRPCPFQSFLALQFRASIFALPDFIIEHCF